MARLRFVDWVLLAVVVLAVHTWISNRELIVNLTGSYDVNEQALSNYQPEWKKEDIREMCQFLEQEVTGEEGDEWVKGNEYDNKLKLRGLHITFRHGERASQIQEDDLIACLPNREIDRKSFAAYKELALSDDVISFLEVDPVLKKIPRVPEDSKCSKGNLTAEGALQHIRLGRYFREKYRNTKLFLEENQRIVTEISTSKYWRTLQSALAFSTEFFYKQRNFVSPVHIKASNYTFQCLDEFCACSIGKKMRLKYEKEHREEFLKMIDKLTSDEVDKVIRQLTHFSSCKDPFELVDVALGQFICRRKPLPCHEEKCVSFDFFNKMINISTVRGTRMFDENIGIAKKLQIVESYPILSYLRQGIDKIQRFPHTNYIRVFSAHDSVVAPLLRVLGIPFVDPPHYTSRLVFEIYEHSDEGLFIRVLYNGRNRTLDVRFCKDDNIKFGMCKATAFKDFSKTGLFALAGLDNLKQACSI